MRSAVSSTVTIDLATTDRVGVDERQVARDIIILGMAVSTLIAGVGIFQTTTYSQRAKELDNYTVDAEVKAALQGLQPADIETKLADMRDQLARLSGVTGPGRQVLSPILRQIVELMPETMWLTKVTASNPLASEKGGMEISLRGRVRGATGAEEQDTAFQFKEILLRDPKLGPLFDVQISVQGKAAAPDLSGGGLDPEALARKLEDRTEFIIELKAKGKS